VKVGEDVVFMQRLRGRTSDLVRAWGDDGGALDPGLEAEPSVAPCSRLARSPDEWALQFEEEYRGRSLVFDDAVRRDDRGRPALTDPVAPLEAEAARAALEDLVLLHDLPLDDGPRLVFGARLAGCEREAGGGWVIRFERDSGVLLTDLDAVVAAMTRPPDEGLRRVLARQQKWLDERAAAAPARP